MKSKNKNYKRNKTKKAFIADRPLPIKRLRLILIVSFIFLALLIIRLFWIQFIDGRLA